MGISNVKKHFDELTGIRAVSAIMVGFFHLGFSEDFLGEFLYNFQTNLNVGVSVFFCLSGFLLTYRYYGNIDYSRKWFFTYFKNRFARIYPVYFLYCLFVLFVKKEGTFSAWLFQFTLLPGLLKPEYQYISQAWSLTVEEMFYLYLPFMLLLLKNKKYILSLLLPYLTGIFIYILFKDIDVTYFSFNNIYNLSRNTLFGRIFEFFCGAMLALFYMNREIKKQQSVKHTLISINLFLFTLLVMTLIRINIFEESKEILLFFRTGIAPFSIVYIFFSLIAEENIVTKILSSRYFVILGKSSYVFYLIHLGPISGILYAKFQLPLLVGHIILWCISIIIYKAWEEPMNDKIRKLF